MLCSKGSKELYEKLTTEEILLNICRLTYAIRRWDYIYKVGCRDYGFARFCFAYEYKYHDDDIPHLSRELIVDYLNELPYRISNTTKLRNIFLYALFRFPAIDNNNETILKLLGYNFFVRDLKSIMRDLEWMAVSLYNKYNQWERDGFSSLDFQESALTVYVDDTLNPDVFSKYPKKIKYDNTEERSFQTYEERVKFYLSKYDFLFSDFQLELYSEKKFPEEIREMVQRVSNVDCEKIDKIKRYEPINQILESTYYTRMLHDYSNQPKSNSYTFLRDNIPEFYEDTVSVIKNKIRYEEILEKLYRVTEKQYPEYYTHELVIVEFENNYNRYMNDYCNKRSKALEQITQSSDTKAEIHSHYYDDIKSLFDIIHNLIYIPEGIDFPLIRHPVDDDYYGEVWWDVDLGYNDIKWIKEELFEENIDYLWEYSDVYNPHSKRYDKERCDESNLWGVKVLNTVTECVKRGQTNYVNLMKNVMIEPDKNSADPKYKYFKEYYDKFFNDKPKFFIQSESKPDLSKYMPKEYHDGHPDYRKPNIAADPIKDLEYIKKIKNYFLNNGDKQYRKRNYTIFCTGISTGLRASDLLTLKVKDVFGDDGMLDEINIHEQKTGNLTHCVLNDEIKQVLFDYICTFDEIIPDAYLFPAPKSYLGHLQVNSLWYMFDRCSKALNLPFHFTTHSLRKTFAYWTIRMHYYDQNIIFSLQDMLNHRDIKNTLYYSGHTKDHLKTLYDDMGKVLNGTVEDTPAISTQEQKINQILDMLTKQIGEHTTSDEE